MIKTRINKLSMYWKFVLAMALFWILGILTDELWVNSKLGNWSATLVAFWDNMSRFLIPIVSVATISGIVIALLQFRTALLVRKRQAREHRFQGTQEVFERFVNKVIPKAREIEQNAVSALLAELEANGFESSDYMDTATFNYLMRAFLLDNHIVDIFNELELQAFVILQGDVDDQQLVNMFARPVVEYCVHNHDIYLICKQTRDYRNLDKLINVWGDNDND